MERNLDSKITAIIKTHDSGDFLCNTLESLKDADEIIILDEHSSDDTIDIAKEYKAKIIYTDKNEISQSVDQALKEASGDWILIVKDDEIIPQRLYSELKKYSESPKKDKYALSLCQKYFYFDKEIKAARKKDMVRFFKKDCIKLKHDDSFDFIPQGCKVYKLNNNFKIQNACLLKYSKDSVFDEMQNFIKTYRLKLKHTQQKHPSVILKPVLYFIYYYFIKGAIFDSYFGYIWAKQKAYKTFLLNVALLEKQKKDNYDN